MKLVRYAAGRCSDGDDSSLAIEPVRCSFSFFFYYYFWQQRSQSDRSGCVRRCYSSLHSKILLLCAPASQRGSFTHLNKLLSPSDHLSLLHCIAKFVDVALSGFKFCLINPSISVQCLASNSAGAVIVDAVLFGFPQISCRVFFCRIRTTDQSHHAHGAHAKLARI